MKYCSETAFIIPVKCYCLMFVHYDLYPLVILRIISDKLNKIAQ